MEMSPEKRQVYLRSKEADELRRVLPRTLKSMIELAKTSPELLDQAVEAEVQSVADEIGGEAERVRETLRQLAEKSYEEEKDSETLAVKERLLNAFEKPRRKDGRQAAA